MRPRTGPAHGACFGGDVDHRSVAALGAANFEATMSTTVDVVHIARLIVTSVVAHECRFALTQVIRLHRMLAILPSAHSCDVPEGDQLRLASGRRPDAAKFEQFEPKRFYLCQDAIHR